MNYRKKRRLVIHGGVLAVAITLVACIAITHEPPSYVVVILGVLAGMTAHTIADVLS